MKPSRYGKILVKFPNMEIAAANEICRQSQKVFLPLLPASKTPLCQSSASLTPSCTSTTSLTAPLGRFCFCRVTCDSCSASCRLLGAASTERRSSRAQLPPQLCSTCPPRRSLTCLPATWASPLQPNPPMHFPFWPGLSNPGI